MNKFSKIAIAIASFAALSAQAGVTASHTSNSVTINGTTYTAPQATPCSSNCAGSAAVPGTASSYSQVQFNSSTWTVTGGQFTQGTVGRAAVAAGAPTPPTQAQLQGFITDVSNAVTAAINAEVSVVNSLVTAANSAIASYSGANGAVASSSVDAAVDAVYTEVNSTRSAIIELRSLNVRIDNAGTGIVIDNSTAHSTSSAASVK